MNTKIVDIVSIPEITILLSKKEKNHTHVELEDKNNRQEY